MNGEPERTSEDRRSDRRAGFGCGGLVLLAALALALVGTTVLSEEGTKTTARVVDCNFRVNRQPDNCRGTWTVDGQFHVGHVQGASSSDVGEQIEVFARGDSATAVEGRGTSATVLFVFAGLTFVAGLAILNSVRKRPRPE